MIAPEFGYESLTLGIAELPQSAKAPVAGTVESWSRWVAAYRCPWQDAFPEPDNDELRHASEIIDEFAARLNSKRPQDVPPAPAPRPRAGPDALPPLQRLRKHITY